MIKLIIVAFVLFVVTGADENSNHKVKYTQIVQPASRQSASPQQHDGYQADGLYPPTQTTPYQLSYQAANEGIYPPAVDSGSDTQAHQSEQALENPSYDPNLYQNFVPQDAVQQYVNSYGGPYAPGAFDGVAGGYAGPYGGHDGHAVGYPVSYGGAYPGGFALQTGYEGFLVPHIPPPPPPPPGFGSGFMDVFRGVLPYPSTIMSMLMRSGTYLLSSIGIVLFGGAVTTAVCTLTPFCTISFAALPFLGLREALTTKTIKESLAGEITSERVRRAAEFVRTALEKYNQIQGDMNKETTTESVTTSSSVKKVKETN